VKARDPKAAQPWIVVGPGGKRTWKTEGPRYEPPICQGEVLNASNKPAHPPETPQPVAEPLVKGQRQCGSCGSDWVPS